MARRPSLAALALSALSLCGCSTASPRQSTPSRELQTANGSKIAFSRGAPAGGIYVMDADGSRLRRVTADAGDDAAAWSPDASEIVFNRYRKGSQDVYLMRADGRRLKKLTGDGASSSPTWSPDGTTIAFAREERGKADIYLTHPDGTHVRRLTRTPLFEYSPAWSPDGARIAYVAYARGPPSSPTRLYVMNADGSHRRRIGPADAALPSWSPDGSKIAFVNEHTGSIWVLNANGSGLRRIVDLTSLSRGRHFQPNFTSRPAWSPDGRKLLFAAGKIGWSHLYIVKVNTSGLGPLTRGAVEDADPAWSRGR